MAIEKMNDHYSMTCPATVYDEEALTTLELVGRTTAKVNEIVDNQNDLVNTVMNHKIQVTQQINEQWDTIELQMEKIKTETVPNVVDSEVNSHIRNGEFDNQIDKYVGGLNNQINNVSKRIDNLVKLSEGSTTGDAELIDGRTDNAGKTWTNIGKNIRHTQDLIGGIYNVNNFVTTVPTATHTDNGYNDINGVWHADSDFKAVAYPCKEGDVFFVSHYNYQCGVPNLPLCCFLKSDGYLLESQHIQATIGYQVTDKYVVTPPGAVKVVFNFEVKSYGINSYSVKKATSVKQGINWSNLKWCCLGDSLTEKNVRSDKNYHDYVAEKTGIQVTNKGVSGAGFKTREEDNVAFYQQALATPSDVSVVTIFGSGNDNGKPLGTPSDTGTETLCGCVNTTLDNLYENRPGVPVGVISPTPWNGQTPDNPDCFMYKYCEAMKQICERRGIPFLDLFRLTGFKANDLGTTHDRYFSKDPSGTNIHPNELGHKVISSHVFNFLQSLVGSY